MVIHDQLTRMLPCLQPAITKAQRESGECIIVDTPDKERNQGALDRRS